MKAALIALAVTLAFLAAPWAVLAVVLAVNTGLALLIVRAARSGSAYPCRWSTS